MPPPSTVARLAGLVVAGMLAALGVAWVTLVAVPSLQASATEWAAFASFAAYAPVVLIPAASLFAALGRRRQRLAALVCLVVLVPAIAETVPTWPHAAPAASGVPVTLLALNTNFGKADPDELWKQIETSRPDVMVLAEIQAPLVAALDARGAERQFPHRIGTAPAGYAINRFESDTGTMVLSTLPLGDAEHLPTPNGQYAVTVQSPSRHFTLLVARPRNVLHGVGDWLSDFAALTDAAARHRGQPLVVAGDFNATRQNLPLRTLLAQGLSDAAELSGAGWLPTYPSGHRLPPVLPIDHVLVGGGMGAASLRTFPIDGTDHLGLLARLTLPT